MLSVESEFGCKNQGNYLNRGASIYVELTVDVSDVPDSEVKNKLGVLVPDRTHKAALGWVYYVGMYYYIFRNRI